MVAMWPPIHEDSTMPSSDSTRWTLIRDAAEGVPAARDEFARRYESVIRAYLGARWRGSPLCAELEDAAQETFLTCFREDGPLDRADPDRPGGFRAYLYGIVRNVARRAEERRIRSHRQPGSGLDLDDIEAREEPLSRVFDRAWAKALLQQALLLLRRRAKEDTDGAARRVELLRLRFREDLPIREIAARWDEDPQQIHRAYAKARKEFASALREVVSDHHPAAAGARLDQECMRLVALLQ